MVDTLAMVDIWACRDRWGFDALPKPMGLSILQLITSLPQRVYVRSVCEHVRLISIDGGRVFGVFA